MIKFVRIVTFLLAVVITVISIFFIDAEQEFAQARLAYRSGDMDQALRKARRANRAFSDDDRKVQAYFLQARAAAKMNWQAKAKDYLDRLLSLDSENVGGLLFRGELQHQLGENEQALPDLNKGLNLLPENSSNTTRAYYHTQRGLTFLALNRDEEANADALEALKFNTNLPEAHDLMSKVFEERGDIKNALAECERAYQLSLERNKLSFMTPEGEKLSDRLVDLRVKYVRSKK
ncbi:hypothetical protein PbJCM13498_34520 [Prolixibacter bellariivorans]|uniref:Uncharacterized protein n=1 Tax=Prolixibacter bellariivorans TaxID=314319 RepID=A0A5M4B352_9BACT|nr:tetratricopeptide repeat protein [Prolixibacter bellariivorans]GET34589.1 hypothetical protein PbJCM13498_34520 [Prolixibacter bellariivorans]